MATMFLSHHSSNPLQVPSDDAINASYLSRLRPLLREEKDRAAHGLPPESSSTPPGELISPSDDGVQAHAPPTSQQRNRLPQSIDLDDIENNDYTYMHRTPRNQEAQDVIDQRPNPLDDEDDGIQADILVPEDFGDVGTIGDIHQQEEELRQQREWDAQLAHAPLDLEEIADLDVDVTAEADDSDRDEEEKTIYVRPPRERRQIELEIRDLMHTVPTLADDYLLLDRLGEGTFSSVYKALDLNYQSYYNTPWLRHHLGPLPKPASNPHRPPKFFVAIKRIYVTSSPSRIANEIAILEDCRGCRNVSQLITAFRAKDQVVVVMPYFKNVDFRDYYTSMSLPTIQSYFRCLFRALRDIHARDIVHRDVKPANFLFDPADGVGTLCDFGLAQHIEYDGPTPCLHTSPTPANPHGKHKTLTPAQVNRVRERTADARKRSVSNSERVGVPEHEARGGVKANRAGTRGFRAPEVLLKCPDQSVALDIWSAGTILLSVLGCKFPIFTASDDVEALMELAAVFGKKTTEKCARLHNRTFICNVPTIDHAGITWQEFAERINPYLYQTVTPKKRKATRPFSSPKRYSRESQPRSIRPLPHRSLGGASISITHNTPSASHSQSQSQSYSTTLHTSLSQATIPASTQASSSRSSISSSSSSVSHPRPRSSSQTSLFSSSSHYHRSFDPEEYEYANPESEPELDENGRPKTQHNRLIREGLDLMARCLHWDSTARITAKEALAHPFLAEDGTGEDGEGGESWINDDESVPHPFGTGVCADLHVRSHSPENPNPPYVLVPLELNGRSVHFPKAVVAGEGIAVGHRPCEFHEEGASVVRVELDDDELTDADADGEPE